jgi:hypothetical protein
MPLAGHTGNAIALPLSAVYRPPVPTTGACCTGATCTVVSSGACTGIFFGPGTTCPGFCPGDTNCDGSIDFFDIDPFLLALFDPTGYSAAYPACAPLGTADVNNDGNVDFFDIDPFLNVLF